MGSTAEGKGELIWSSKVPPRGREVWTSGQQGRGEGELIRSSKEGLVSSPLIRVDSRGDFTGTADFVEFGRICN